MSQSEINSLTIKFGWCYEVLSFNPNEKNGNNHYILSVKERDWLTPMSYKYEGI
ncbi:hypothetical protein [Enterococcus faecium]|uniref:hypothetical protein n=1 Tax=Enterococcus faecium TaxID=1352 RepID=UPI003F79967F